MEQLHSFCDEYKDYISGCKTEWEASDYLVAQLEAHGFHPLERDFEQHRSLNEGDKVYRTNRDRGVCAAVIGRQSDCRVIASHIDSPLVFLRPAPVYGACGYALGATFNRGGIKHYQWLSLPLALHGKAVLKDGTVLSLKIGEDEADPVVYIADLAAHLSGELMGKTVKEGFRGENLNVILGTCKEQEACAAYINEILKSKYGLSCDDLKYSELYVVPAMKARDVGLDRSLIAAYGHDDRVCAFAALQALLASEMTFKTAVALFQDKEELGSMGNTGATSRFYNQFLRDIQILRTGRADPHELAEHFSRGQVINADVTFLREPMNDSLLDEANNGSAGQGTCVAVYGSNTLPQFRGAFMRMLDRHEVPWQLSTGRADGLSFFSSVAQSFNSYNMDTISMGPGLNSMHSTYELVSKADLYATYLGYRAFYGDEQL